MNILNLIHNTFLPLHVLFSNQQVGTSAGKNKHIETEKSLQSSPQLPTFGKIWKYYIHQNDHAKVRTAFDYYISHALNTDGNIIAEAYTDETDGNNIWVIEQWEDKHYANQYETSPYAKALYDLTRNIAITKPEIIPLIDLEPPSNYARTKNMQLSINPITMMLFIHAKEGTSEKIKQLYHSALPILRSIEDILLYNFSQFQESETQFVTFEKFIDDVAFQDHLKMPTVQPILEFLQDSIQNPPFERHFYRLKKFT